MRSLLLAAAVLVTAPASALAQAMTNDELRAEFSGTTVSGFHDGGVHFTEYHSPDGRIFGYNNNEPVQDGCWDVKDDAVCYYYAKGRIQGTFCWRFERVAAGGYRITSLETPSRGITRREPGNPRGLSDNGRPWTCDPLTSRLDDRSRQTLRGFARLSPLPR